MSFRFNFSSDVDEGFKSEVENDADQDAEKLDKPSIQPVKEIAVSDDHTNHEGLVIESIKIGPTTLQFLEPTAVEVKIKSEDDTSSGVTKAISEHSDLLAHVYEDQDAEKLDKPSIQPVKEIAVSDDHTNHEGLVIESIKIGPTTLQFLEPTAVEVKIKSEDDTSSGVTKAISEHSDLLAHVYEGGLKIWECSIDLAHYLHEADIDFTDKMVIELGCGAGLPGIFALNHGATKVVFQDYNEEVLQEMTIPNVLLNRPDEKEDIVQRCQFLAGDWSLLENFLKKAGQSEKYDIILTSETIYSIESQPILHDLLKALLNPQGIVYVAAKTHYFGVGGGTRMFEDLVKERADFTIGVCKEYKQGVQREILKMELIQKEDDSR